MTRESRLVVDLEEVAGLRWQCNKCGSAILYQLGQSIILPQVCPSCNQPLVEAAAFDSFHELQGFANALKSALRAHGSKSAGTTLKLEFIDKAR